MSARMVWRPLPIEPDGNRVNYQVHRAIAQRFFGHDGTLTGVAALSKKDITYLEGLRDAWETNRTPTTDTWRVDACNDLNVLINALWEHGAIELEITR